MRALIVAVAVLLLAPAASDATTIGFDDHPPGTVLTTQYAPQGVTFGPLPGTAGDGLDPVVAAPGPFVANSGSQVASLDNCFACEFYVPNTTGTFAEPQDTVSVRVGLLGPAAPACAPESTDTTCSQTTLIAYDASGSPVGTPASATLTQGAPVRTLLEVTVPTAAIVGFRVTQRDTTDLNKPIAIDDLTFTATGPPPPPDFSLSASRSLVDIAQGQTVATDIAIGRFSGSSGSVDFTVSGVPAGITATVTPDPAPGVSATLTLAAAPDVAPTGNELPTITVTGTPAGPAVGSAPRSTAVQVQVKEAFGVRVSGPAHVALAPCEAQVPIIVSRDFSLPGPVELGLAVTGSGISGFLSATEATFPNGSAGQRIVLTVRGDPTGRPVGPSTFTVTGHVDGLPDRVAQVTVSGTCPVGYDARVTSLMVTQGTQVPFLPTRASHPNGLRYRTLPGAAKLRRGAPTVVRVYANLVHGPAQGVAGVPAVLHGATGSTPLPGSPLLPVSGARTLRTGPEAPPDGEIASETAAYTFVLPDEWTTRSEIGLRAAVQAAPVSQAQGQVAACDTAGCRANDEMRLREIDFDGTRTRTIRPVRMTWSGGDPLPAPEEVFDWTRLAWPVDWRIEPYRGTIDITDIATGTSSEKNKAVADRLHDWMCDHKVPDGGWIVGVNTGVAHGLQRDSAVCVAPPRAPDIAVVEFKRPLTSTGHEVGHLLGRPHASPACGADKAEAWPPDERGLTQSIGLDVRQGSGTTGPFAILSPPGTKEWFDPMGYCGDNGGVSDIVAGPRAQDHWSSVRNWNRVFTDWDFFRRRAAHVRTPLQAGPTVPSLRVSGVADGAGASIGTVEPVRARQPAPAGSRFRLLGFDATGATVADVPMRESAQHVDGVPEQTALDGTAPAAGVVAVAIALDGQVLAERRRTPAAPRVTARAVPRFRRGRATIRWRQSDPDGGPLTTAVAYAADGRTFQRVWSGVGASRAVVPAGHLPRARRARLRITVNDGFREASATTRPFRSPGARPAVRITAPLPGARQPVDAALVLRGEAYDDAGRRLEGRRLVWRAGRERIGRGEAVAAMGLAPGRRRITLTARDRSGRTGRASVQVRLRAATPFLLRLRAPARLGRRARVLRLRVAASQPARLSVRGRHHRVGRRLRTLRVRVPRGTQPLTLTLRLSADGRTSVRRVRVARG